MIYWKRDLLQTDTLVCLKNSIISTLIYHEHRDEHECDKYVITLSFIQAVISQCYINRLKYYLITTYKLICRIEDHDLKNALVLSARM